MEEAHQASVGCTVMSEGKGSQKGGVAWICLFLPPEKPQGGCESCDSMGAAHSWRRWYVGLCEEGRVQETFPPASSLLTLEARAEWAGQDRVRDTGVGRSAERGPHC